MRHLATFLVVTAFAWSLLGVPYCPLNGSGTASEDHASHGGGSTHAHQHGDEGTVGEGPGEEHPADHCDASFHCVSPALASPEAAAAPGHTPSHRAVDRPVALYRSPPPFSEAPPPRPIA